MARPQPQIGLVVRYDFLWSHEREQGYGAGIKDRPCVIVTAIRRGPDGQIEVLVAPITHAEPPQGEAAIAIPTRVGRHLGLDDARSYVIAGEVNAVSWDDPGFTPALPGRRWAYGRLPEALYRVLRSTMLDLAQGGRLKSTRRDG